VPDAVVRVPFLEKECLPPPRYDHPWFIAPHAAAIVLLTLLGRLLARFRVRRVVANVFEPVSERGASGLEELHEQTVRLLSFKEFPREVFDAQVAFNLLPRYGEHSATRLEEVESTIVREIERAHPAAAGPLALRVIQVPVFHCHTVSLLVELEEPVEIAVMEEALRGDRLAVRGHRESPMAAVDVAGQEEIVVGPVRRDFKCRNAFWLWAAADNLRLPARTGVDIAETLLP
jgi:aspartate-semialdehyde dehydrogenase